MTTIQTKFFRQLDAAVSQLTDKELVTRPAWANTGAGSVQPTTGFGSLRDFTYDFQDGYARFTVDGVRIAATYSSTPTPNERTLDDVIAAIVQGLS